MSWLQKTLYIQVSPNRLTVRDPNSGQIFSEIPEVAIAYVPKERIVEIGSAARSANIGLNGVVVNPFAHPRSIVSDFIVAEQLIKAVIRKFLHRSIFSPSPKIVMHPLGNPAGGYTQVERRALREMAIGAGAATAVLWIGRELTDQELLAASFPAGGEVE